MLNSSYVQKIQTVHILAQRLATWAVDCLVDDAPVYQQHERDTEHVMRMLQNALMLISHPEQEPQESTRKDLDPARW